MPRSPAEFSRRVAEVLRHDGVSGVVSKSLARLGGLLYRRSDYLVFSHDLRPIAFTPRRANIDVTAVCSQGDVERLPGGVRKALDPTGRRLGRHMETGGMVFCVILEGKLAHQLWVGTQRTPFVDPIGPYLDYDRLAYLGAGETAPEFRGQGILPLVLCRICETLKSRGFTRALATVSPANGSSIRGITKAGFRPAGRGKLTRCLGRYSWRRDPSTLEEKR